MCFKQVNGVFIYFENEKTILAGIQEFGTTSIHDTEIPSLIFSISSAGYIGTLFKQLRCVQCYTAYSQVLIAVEKDASVH